MLMTQITTQKLADLIKAKQHIIDMLLPQVEAYSHGYFGVPSTSIKEHAHTVHVNENYFPDMCTCDGYKHGHFCIHSLTVYIKLAVRREELKNFPQPVIEYIDWETNTPRAGRYDMLTPEEKRAYEWANSLSTL